MKSICFKEWEVKAMMDGTKTQFVRPIKTQGFENIWEETLPNGNKCFVSDLKHIYGKRLLFLPLRKARRLGGGERGVCSWYDWL